MVRTLTRRFAVGVLGLFAAVLAVASTGAEVSANYPYNFGIPGYGYQQFAGQPFQQFPGQPFQQFAAQGPLVAPPFAAAPRFYYRDNRYCGDGILFIENGINYCGNTGARVFPIYPDFVPFGGGFNQFGYGFNQFGYYR